MLRKVLGTFGLFAALFALVIAPAQASVTFDPATGTGFVGKGDVQLAFGWNNAQLQANATGVSFSYDSAATYSAVCTWVTGEGTRGEREHNVTIPRHTSVNAEITYDARKNTQNQITGFTLKGFGTFTTDGAIPAVGGPCPGNEGNEGTWTSVTLISESNGGLYVNYGTQSALLQ